MDHEDRQISELFSRDGFVVGVEPVLSADLVARARDGMDRIRVGDYRTGVPPEPSPWTPGDPEDSMVKIEMPQLADPDVRELISNPAIGALAARATGARRVQVFWVQMLEKPAGRVDPQSSDLVGWHQDWSYWSTTWHGHEGLCTAWVALSDIGADAAPMTFIPGSHRWGADLGGDFFSQEDQRPHLELPPDAHWEERPALMPRGGMSIHGPLTLHGSGHVESDLRRRSLAIHLCSEKSRPVREGENLARFLHDPAVCPVIHDAEAASG